MLKLLETASRQENKTVLIITHNAALAQMADRVIHINDAKVRSIEDNSNPTPIEDIEW